MKRPLRLGIAQTNNSYDYNTNLSSILGAIDTHAKAGTDLVLFPECAVTGFNRGLLEINGDRVLDSVQAIQQRAKDAGLWLALPTPWARDGGFTNAVLVIDDQGALRHVFHKIGFQKGEDRLFLPGMPHHRTFEIKEHRVGVVICIESSHGAWDYLDRTDRPDVILWPGFYATQPGLTWSDSTSQDDLNVKANIDQWQVPVIQATCSSSPEAEHWPDKRFGGSLVLDSRGVAVFQARLSAEDCVSIEMEKGSITVRQLPSARMEKELH